METDVSNDNLSASPLIGTSQAQAETNVSADPPPLAETTGSNVIDRLMKEFAPELGKIPMGNMRMCDALAYLKNALKLRVHITGDNRIDPIKFELALVGRKTKELRKDRRKIVKTHKQVIATLKSLNTKSRQLRSEIRELKN